MDTVVNTIPLPNPSGGTYMMFGLAADDFATSSSSGAAATQTLLVATGQVPFVVADPTLSGSTALVYPPSLVSTPLQMTGADGTKYQLQLGRAVAIGTIPYTDSSGNSTNKHVAVVVGSGTVTAAGVSNPGAALLAVLDMTAAYNPGSPYMPIPIGFLQLSATGTDVKLKGNVAAVATGTNILLVNLANPYQPMAAGQINGTFGNWLALTPSELLVGSSPSAVQITDLDPILLAVKEVSFSGNCQPANSWAAGCISVYQDAVGSATPIMNPVWKDSNAPYSSNAANANGPAAYVQGQTIKLTAKFAVDPLPSAPIGNVTVTGSVDGLGNCVATGVTIPTAPSLTLSCTMNHPLPTNQTKFYNPMSIKWSYSTGPASSPLPIGTTKNLVYVTLAQPLQYTANYSNSSPVVFRTTLHLAVSNDGATDQASAFNKTWSQFSNGGNGPTNIQTWDGRPLYYYLAGHGFGPVCALNEYSLLTYQAEVFSGNQVTGFNPSGGSGQCGSFARTLIGAFAVNGIASNFVHISSADGTEFLVKDWTYGAPSFPNATGGYRWKMVFNPVAIDNGDLMVPQPQPDPTNYGDLMSGTGKPGQNTAPPSEKVFGAHFIVKVNLQGVSPSYYDPSYGVTYTDANDFENKAVAGYLNPNHNNADPPNVFRVKQSTGLMNIIFQ